MPTRCWSRVTSGVRPRLKGTTSILRRSVVRIFLRKASILGMYDPDRSQSIVSLGDQQSWQAFVTAIRGPLSAQKALKGAGIRILTTTISSPTLADQLNNFLKIYPEAKWHVYEPVESRQRARRCEAGLRPAGRNALRLLKRPT